MSFGRRFYGRVLRVLGLRPQHFELRDLRWLGDLPAAVDQLKTLYFARAVRPVPMSAPTGNIVVIAPHSDDEVIGPGGTLLLATQTGAKITTIVLTRGAGAEGAIREAESRAAAARLGAVVVPLGLEDGAIRIDGETISSLVTAIEAARADVVMLPCFFDDHDDHRRACEFLLHAAPQLTVWPEIWAYQVYGGILGNAIVDVTDVVAAKSDLIRVFASQAAHRDWANFSQGLAAWNSRFLARTDTAFAEMFLVLPFGEWVDMAKAFFTSPVAYIGTTYRAR